MLNNSRVLPARLYGYREGTGGKMEFLLLNQRGNDVWEVMVKPGKKRKRGAVCLWRRPADSGDRRGRPKRATAWPGFITRGIFITSWTRLARCPCLTTSPTSWRDKERYQTVYSKDVGSAAAPTAGLHFTPGTAGQASGKRGEDRVRHPPCGPWHLSVGKNRGNHRPQDALRNTTGCRRTPLL